MSYVLACCVRFSLGEDLQHSHLGWTLQLSGGVLNETSVIGGSLLRSHGRLLWRSVRLFFPQFSHTEPKQGRFAVIGTERDRAKPGGETMTYERQTCLTKLPNGLLIHRLSVRFRPLSSRKTPERTREIPHQGTHLGLGRSFPPHNFPTLRTTWSESGAGATGGAA